MCGGAVPGRRQNRGMPRTWHVALLYAALTVALAHPLARHAAEHVLSVSPDTDLFLWTLSWDTYAFTHHPWSIFDANIFYPQPRTLAYSENLIGSGLFAAPILWLTRHPVLAMNLVALPSCVLCGVGGYVLARRAGVGLLGAALSGLIFAFTPPRFLRLDQLFLTTIQWVPFGLAYVQAYLDEGRPFDVRVAIAFFIGPPFGLWPLVHWLSGFNFIRAPSRFMLLAVLGLSVLAGAGFDRVSVRLAASTRLVVAAIVAALLV